MTDSNKTVRPWTQDEWEVIHASILDEPVDGYVRIMPKSREINGISTCLDICTVFTSDSSESEQHHNARLIAAAPALYEALDALYQASITGEYDFHDQGHVIESALRKANPAAFEAPGHE